MVEPRTTTDMQNESMLLARQDDSCKELTVLLERISLDDASQFNRRRPRSIGSSEHQNKYRQVKRRKRLKRKSSDNARINYKAGWCGDCFACRQTQRDQIKAAAASARIKARRKFALVIQKKLWKTTSKKPGVRKKPVRRQTKANLPIKGKKEFKKEDVGKNPTKSKKKAILIKVKTEHGEELNKEPHSTIYTGKKGRPTQKQPKNEEIVKMEPEYEEREVDDSNACPNCDYDHWLYCSICDRSFHGDCPIHGPPCHLKDKTVCPDSKTSAARATLPDALYLDISSIPNAGTGVFAREEISERTRFGPYVGECRIDDAIESSYNWEIITQKGVSHCIDAEDENQSNWLRFVNCPRLESEQNLVAVQYRGQIYYHAYKPIYPGQELLVWYGSQFAQSLGLLESEGTERKESKPTKHRKICQKCFMVFNTCKGLSSHERYACQSLIKICPICGICFKNEQFLQKHLLNHSEKTSNREKMMENVRAFLRLQCRVYNCDKNFESKQMLVNHLMQAHKLKDEICIECGKDLRTVELLQNHVITVHQGDLPWKCPECQRKFHTRYLIEQHMATHSGMKKYHCDVCGSFFSFYNSLDQHRKSCRAISFRFACIRCRKAFKDRKSVVFHMEEQCRYSKRAAERKEINGYEEDAKFHLSENQVSASNPASVSRPSSSFQANATFSPQEYFICDFAGCEETFDCLKERNLHYQRKHPCGKAIHRCMICKKQYTFASSYVSHLQNVHSITGPIKCSNCPFASDKKEIYVNHVKTCFHHLKKKRAQTRAVRKQRQLAVKVRRIKQDAVSEDGVDTFTQSRPVSKSNAQARNSVAQDLQDFNVTSSNDVLLKSEIAADDETFFDISEFCLMEKAPTVCTKEVDFPLYDGSTTISASSGSEMDSIDNQNISLGSQEKESLEKWLSIDESAPAKMTNLPEGFEDLPVQCNVMLSDDLPQALVQVEPCSVQTIDSTSSELSSEGGELIIDENSSNDATIKSDFVQGENAVQEGNIFNKLLADLLHESPKDPILESQTLRMSSECIGNAEKKGFNVNDTVTCNNGNLTIDEAQEHYILPSIDDLVVDSELYENTISEPFREALPGQTNVMTLLEELKDTLTTAESCMPDHEQSSQSAEQKEYPFDFVTACRDNEAARISLCRVNELPILRQDISIFTATKNYSQQDGSSVLYTGEASGDEQHEKTEVIPKDVRHNYEDFADSKDSNQHCARPGVTFATTTTSVSLQTKTGFENLTTEKENGKHLSKQGIIVCDDSAKPASLANACSANLALERDDGKHLTIPGMIIGDKTATSANFSPYTSKSENIEVEKDDVFQQPLLPLSTITGDDAPQSPHLNESIAKSPCFKIISSTQRSISHTAHGDISIDSGDNDDIITEDNELNLSELETPGIVNNFLADSPFNYSDDGTKLLERMLESPLKIVSQLDTSSTSESAENGRRNLIYKENESVQGTCEQIKAEQQGYSGNANDTEVADRCSAERNNEFEQLQSAESMISLSNEHANENCEVESKATGATKDHQTLSASRNTHLPSVDSGFDSPEGIPNPNETLSTEHETNESQQTSTGPNSDSCCLSFASARQIHDMMEDCAVSNDTMFPDIGTNSSDILNDVTVHCNEDMVFPPNVLETGNCSNLAQDKQTGTVNLNGLKESDAKENGFAEDLVDNQKEIEDNEIKLKCGKCEQNVDPTCSAENVLENGTEIKATNEATEIAVEIGDAVPKEIALLDALKRPSLADSQIQAQDTLPRNLVFPIDDGSSENTMEMDEDIKRVIQAYMKENEKTLALGGRPESPIAECSRSDDVLTPSNLADSFVKSCERVTFSRLSTSHDRDSCKRDIINDLSSCEVTYGSGNNDLKSGITQESGNSKNLCLSGTIGAGGGGTKVNIGIANSLMNRNMSGKTEVRKSGAHRAWGDVETDVLYGDWMSNKSKTPNQVSNASMKSNLSKLAAKIFKGTDTSSSTFDNNLFANCSGKILKEETSQLTSDEIRQRLRGVGRIMSCKTQNSPLSSKSNADTDSPAVRNVFSSKLDSRPSNLVQPSRKVLVPGPTRPSGLVASAPKERRGGDTIPSFQGSRILQKSKLGQSRDESFKEIAKRVVPKFGMFPKNQRTPESTAIGNVVKSRNHVIIDSKKQAFLKVTDVKIVPQQSSNIAPKKVEKWEQMLEECGSPQPCMPANVGLNVESDEAKTPREKINAAWGAFHVNKPIANINVKPKRSKRKSVKNEIHNGPMFTFHKLADEKAKKRDLLTKEVKPKERVPDISNTGPIDDRKECGSLTNQKAKKEDLLTKEVRPQESGPDISNTGPIDDREECGSPTKEKAKQRDPQTAEAKPKERMPDISNTGPIDDREGCGSPTNEKARKRDPQTAEVKPKERMPDVSNTKSAADKEIEQEKSDVTLESERILREVKLDTMILSDVNSRLEVPAPLVQFSSSDSRKNGFDSTPILSSRKRKLEPLEDPKQVKRSRNEELINPVSESMIAATTIANAGVKCFIQKQAIAEKNLACDGIEVVDKTNLENQLEQSLLKAEKLLVEKKRNPFLTIDINAIGGLSQLNDSSTTDTSETASSSDSDGSMLEKKIEEKKAYCSLLLKEIKTIKRRIKTKTSNKGSKFRLKKQVNKRESRDNQNKGRSFIPKDQKNFSRFKDIPPYSSKLFKRNCAFAEIGKRIKYFRRRKLVVQLTDFRSIGTKGNGEKSYHCELCCRTFELKPCVVPIERCTSHPPKVI